MVVFNIITYFAAIIAILLSIVLPKKYGFILRKLAEIWGKVGMITALSPVEVRGKENLIEDSGMIICNHQSSFDIFTCIGYYPKDFLFFSKKEIFYLPFVGTAMKKMNYISVDRKNPKRAARAIREAIKKIKNNHSVLIYPEGTRSPNPDQILPFKPGTFLIARQGKIPIMPAVIYGTGKLYPAKKSFYLFPHKVIMQILPPIMPDNPIHPANTTSVAEEDKMLDKIINQFSDTYKKLADEIH